MALPWKVAPQPVTSAGGGGPSGQPDAFTSEAGAGAIGQPVAAPGEGPPLTRDGEEDRRYPWLYHERQVGALCAVHSLNNLLQGPYFDENGLREVTLELDQAERALTEGLGLDEGNARTDGYFNVQVMQVVLGRVGFEMLPLRQSDGTDPTEETAFILNRRMHWFTVLKVRGEWFDLNSRLRHPQRYAVQDVRAQLAGFMTEGWTVFVVRGDFASMWGEARPTSKSPGAAVREVSRVRRCGRAVAAFTCHWFDGQRFDPAASPRADGAASARQLGGGGGGKEVAAAAAASGQPGDGTEGAADPEAGREAAAAVAQGCGEDEQGGGPHRPHPPQEEAAAPSPAPPPPQAPPQLQRGFVDPDYDLHFRVEDRSFEQELPKCPLKHDLMALGKTRDNGWSCDGRDFRGGCKSGITGRDQSYGVNRWRCNICDYDLCEQCYWLCCEGIQEVEPERPKPRNKNHPPIMVICQCFIIVVLWLISTLRDGSGGDLASQPAGLEELTKGSYATGVTTFVLYRDCRDLRLQAWRWLTYQYSHGSLAHVCGSLVLLALVGAPVEAYHGGTLLMLFLNVGVLGGACGQSLLNVHEELLGMSAGCLGLLGMHVSDVILNFRHARFRWGKLLVLTLVLAFDVGLTAWLLQPVGPHLGSSLGRGLADRMGGLFVGLLLGLAFGRNLLRKCTSRAVKASASLLIFAFFQFGILWISQWPPRTVLYPEPFCWSRWAYNSSSSSSSASAPPSRGAPQCVRCGDQACMDYWSQQVRATLHERLDCNEAWTDLPP